MEAAWTGLCVSDGEPMDVRVIKCFVSVLFLQQEVHYAALSSSFFSGPSIYHVFSWSWIKALLTEKKIKLAAMLIVDERNACKFEKERLILYSCSPVGTACRLDMIACKQTNSSGQIRIEKNWWIVDWKKKKDLHQVVSSKFSLKEFHSTSQSFRVLTLHFNFACNQPSMDCEFVIDRKWALFFRDIR